MDRCQLEEKPVDRIIDTTVRLINYFFPHYEYLDRDLLLSELVLAFDELWTTFPEQLQDQETVHTFLTDLTMMRRTLNYAEQQALNNGGVLQPIVNIFLMAIPRLPPHLAQQIEAEIRRVVYEHVMAMGH